MTSSLPILLPLQAPTNSRHTGPSLPGWTPKKYLSPLQPPPVDDLKLNDAELANARHLLDGKQLKKTRPRRTVDYNGGMGRWILMRKMRLNPSYVPCLRPAPPYIIDLLPPKAYPDNASMSLCTKFVHTSTNKIRCPVNVVSWTPEGRRVLTGSTSGEFTLWNGLTFNFETILQAHDSAIRAFQFTHSGLFLASADQTGIIKYFQPNMNNLTAWQGHREAIRGLSFSPDDGRFATASDDSTVSIWSFEESRKEIVLTGHGWDVKCVEWHPTKGLLVSGSKDNLIKFWDPRTGTVLSTLHQHKNTIQAVSWSPNGNLVASASRDQTVRVFDIRAMKECCVLKGHKKEVCSLAWHPVHPILVSGGSEGAILHWDLSTPGPAVIPLQQQQQQHHHSNNYIPYVQQNQQPRATLAQAHDSNVWALTFHPLGHLLVSASNDHTTRFWSRERPFNIGEEKLPDAGAPPEDEDDALIVPGLGAGEGAPDWWAQEDGPPPFSSAAAENGFGRNFGEASISGSDDYLPGFSVAEHQRQQQHLASAGRQSVPLPSQEEMFGVGGEEWSRGASGRGSRWSPRRGWPRH